MVSAGWATLDVIPSVKGIARELDKQTSGPLAAAGKRGGEQFGTTAGRSAGSRFGSVFSKAAKASMLGLAGVSALAFKVGKDSIEQASELGESLNAVNVSYDKQARAVRRLGEEAATSLGLSNAEFNGLAVQFSAFATQIAGGEGPKVVGVLDDLTERGADFASVMNLDVAEAMGLFQSGLAGETEPLRKFGIDLSAAAVEAHALAEGITSGKKEMTEGEKVQARYSLLMQSTAKTAGDFANTSDSLANRQRILNARWDDARAKLGNALLPAVEEITGFLIDEGIPAFEDFSDWFTDDGLPAIKDFAGWAEDELLPVIKDVGEFLKDAADKGGDLLEALNDLPDPAKYAGLVAALGGGAALKLRSGKGALGGVGSALGLAKPVPVFVTNKGFGTTGLGAGGAHKGTGKVASGLKTGAKALPVIGAVAVGYELGGDEFAAGARGGGMLGLGDIKGLKERADAGAAAIDDAYDPALGRLRSNLAAFGDELDLVGNKKVDPSLTIPRLPEERRNLERFYELEVKAGRPISPNLRVLGYDEAMDKLYRLREFKIGDKTVNIHTTRTGAGDLDYLSGGISGARANGGHVNPRESYLVGERGPEIFRPAGAGSIVPNHELARAGAGVQVSIGTVVAHDYQDFMGQTQRRAQKAQLDGVRSGR